MIMSANDSRRFCAFADFIHNTYPTVKTVADIAGGRGNLSYYLHKLGYNSTIIDSRFTKLPAWMIKTLRKLSVKKGKLIEIPRIVNKVQDVDLSSFDLVVGLHPDEATEHVIIKAIKYNKSFAIVPCCVFPIDGKKRSEINWIEYLASLAPNIKEAELPINGARKVLYRNISLNTVHC